jgi:Skp family chaperone for outer membrane proteins
LSDEVIATLNKTASKSASAATSLASSAGLQVGYIDMDRAFKAMPESKQAEAEINELKEAARTKIANADATVKAEKEKELQEVAMKKRETIVQKLTGSISHRAEVSISFSIRAARA